MAYHVEGFSVVFANGNRHKFHDIIGEVLEFEDSLVVRLNSDSIHRTNRNVFAFDYRGNMLWQIPLRTHLNEHSPYVGLYRAGEWVDAYNWDGQILTLHPRSGMVISEGYVSVDPPTSRRHRSPKSYM